ncbi:MAG TPA: hypothetical protein VFY27_05915 [Woeseiaceae bacterium]|nr:hypothetical protein [Woeseiaceae bacterium]
MANRPDYCADFRGSSGDSGVIFGRRRSGTFTVSRSLQERLSCLLVPISVEQ